MKLTSVKGSRVVVALDPRIDEGNLIGPVGDDGRELSSLEEVLLREVQSDHLVDPRVDV